MSKLTYLLFSSLLLPYYAVGTNKLLPISPLHKVYTPNLWQPFSSKLDVAFLSRSFQLQTVINKQQATPKKKTRRSPTQTKNVHSTDAKRINGQEAHFQAQVASPDGARGQELPETVQSTIQYNAQDAIVFDIKQQKIYLHGNSKIDYDQIKLEAEEISLDWATNTIQANGKKNEAGKLFGKPVLTQIEEEKDRYGKPTSKKNTSQYIAEKIRYHLKSKRAIATKLLTKQDEAIIQGTKMKKDAEDKFYIQDVRYTTCDLANPHFYISAKKIKLVPDNKIISTPFRFYFDGVPTPLGFFFGILFLPGKRTAGIILPQFGETAQDGFYLREGGYYINFHDYADCTLKGSMYSTGAVSAQAALRYKKRYQYVGKLLYQRDRRQGNDKKIQDKSWLFTWQHKTDAYRNSTLAADVEFRSKSFSTHDTLKKEKPKTTSSASIQYMKKLVGLPYKFTLSLRHTKDFQSNITKCTLPHILLSTRSIYPLRTKGSTTRGFYKDIYFQHTVEFENKISNENKNSNDIDKQPIDFLRNFQTLAKDAKYGAKHTVPIKSDIKVFQYINLTPAITYQERWYWKELAYDLEYPNEQAVQPTTKEKFRRVWDFSFSTDLKTALYGRYTFGQGAKVQAIKHDLFPLLSFTYTPDFSKPKYRYWETIKVNGKEEKRSKFADFVYGAPRERATAVLTAKLNNQLSLKIKQNPDTTGRATKKVPLLEAFNLSTSYDFLAASFPLSNIELDAKTCLFNDYVNISSRTTFDPYIYETGVPNERNDKEQRMEAFAWQHGKGLGRVETASISIRTKLRPKDKPNKKKKNSEETADRLSIDEMFQSKATQHVNFDIPWNLNLGFEWRYKRGEKKTIKSIPFDGDFNLTKKWKISLKSCYDILKKELVASATRIHLFRDLHCWEMNFDWYPLGEEQSYDFSIGIKAAVLKKVVKYPRKRKFKNYN